MSGSDLLRYGSYNIQQIPGRPFHFEQHPYVFRLSNILTWTVWASYMVTQGIILYSTSRSSGTFLRYYWAAWFAELFLSANELVHGLHLICQLLRTAKVDLPRPHFRLIGDSAPSVDVFIPCCGEPIDIILNTVAAAAGQDYPASRLRVVVLDDGHDDSLRIAVESLQRSRRLGGEIFYRSRTLRAGEDSYFKAGNLRYGIHETALVTGGEYFASIDADMLPDSEWLRRMIPHFIIDSRLAMLNQPQYYYNIPKDDLLAEQAEYDMWFTIFEPLNDRVGAAMCQGSGFLVRRSALEMIGGWPLAHTGEDVMCSLKLLFGGWKLGFVREYLQYGLTPESLGARLKQKTRWAADVLEFLREYGFYLTTSKIGALAHRDLTSIATTLGLVVLPIALFISTAIYSTITLSANQYNLIRSLLLLTFITSKVNDYVVYGHLGLSRFAHYQSLNVWCAPYAAVQYIRTLLPFTATPNFFVTGTFISPTNERSRQKRAGIVKRLLSSGLPMNITYVLCSSAVLVFCISRSAPLLASTTSPQFGVCEVLILPGPALKLASVMWKVFVPVLYMITPPTVPEWHEFLERDSKGVLRPKRPIERIMDPHGSCTDTSNAVYFYDALETIVLLCFLLQSF